MYCGERIGGLYFLRPVQIDRDEVFPVTRAVFLGWWRRWGGTDEQIQEAESLSGDYKVI